MKETYLSNSEYEATPLVRRELFWDSVYSAALAWGVETVWRAVEGGTPVSQLPEPAFWFIVFGGILVAFRLRRKWRKHARESPRPGK
jgi:hypothetical protein